jgi:small subunit ribosomal protein S8e
MQRLGRKISGGKYKKFRKKKLYELPGKPRPVRLGTEKRKMLKGRSGILKSVLLTAEKAYVLDKKTGKIKAAKIKTVLETPSNQFLARANLLMKGAIIDTDAGKARITNRPGQEGKIQAVLVD